MAKMIPGKGTASQAFFKVWDALKKLSDAYTVISRLQGSLDNTPELLVCGPLNTAIVLKVWELKEAEAKTFKQPSLFDRLLNRNLLDLQIGYTQSQSLLQFVQLAKANGISAQFSTAIVMPFVSAKVAKNILLKDVTLLNKDDLDSQHLVENLVSTMKPLDADNIERLRALHTPESVIPGTITTRRKIQRNIQASTVPMLLSYDQDAILKHDLYLPEEGQQQARDIDLRLINGVAGSGKSLILLYRIKLLQEMFPTRRVLIITFNKALIQDLERKYEQVGKHYNIEWASIYAWCGKKLKGFTKTKTKPWERTALIAKLKTIHLPTINLTNEALVQEIDWIKEQLIFTRQAYLDADRKGRGIGFTRQTREKIYDLFEAYQANLPQQQCDWSDIPRELYLRLSLGKSHLQQYDEILIDEAQFFAPIWWELVKFALAPKGRLFIVADPTQGFLKNRQTWKSLGLHVVGRSVKLNRSYRTTYEIMNFAKGWYQSRTNSDDDDVVEPILVDMPHGEKPRIISTPTEQDQLKRLSNEIQSYLDQNVLAQHILILTHGKPDGVIQYLQKQFSAISFCDPSDKQADNLDKAIRVCSLNSATGLEAPLVFILDLQISFAKEEDSMLSDDERAELIQENTRRFYMAITRAGQSLTLMMRGGTSTKGIQTLQRLLE